MNMNKWGLKSLPGMSIGLLMMLASGAVGQTQISWLSSVQKALDLAKQENKMVMVSFFDPKDKWCFSMDFYTFSDPRAADRASRGFFPVRLERGKHDGEIRRFDIRRYPTLLFLDPSGEEIDRCEQYLAPEAFVQFLNMIETGTGTYQDCKRKVESNPNDPESCFRLAEKLLIRDQCDEAVEYYQRAIALDPEEKNWFTPEAELGIAFALGQDGKHEKAIKALEEFCEGHPDSPLTAKARFSIALTHFFAGKDVRAEKMLREVSMAFPDTVWGKKAAIMSEEMKLAREKPEESNFRVNWEDNFLGSENLLEQGSKPLSTESWLPETDKKKKKKKK